MIRAQVLRAIALNREPGFHFAGNLAEVSFDAVAPHDARVSVEPCAPILDRDGQVNFGVVAMVVDMALAATIRASLDPATRLATVQMALQLTGARLDSRLEARAQFEGFIGNGTARQGLARLALEGAAGRVGIAHGAFMPITAPAGVARMPLPLRGRPAPVLSLKDLTAEERKILRRADALLAESEHDFARRLFGFDPKRTASGATCVMRNGAHVGNRVGHVQGGLMMGLAAATAAAPLPAHWKLSGISACFVSPGTGTTLRAASKILHQGSATAVVRTTLTAAGGRRVLDATTTHCR